MAHKMMTGQTLMPFGVPVVSVEHRGELLRLVADDWRDSAACTSPNASVRDSRGVDPFYPADPDTLTDVARSICGRCPVQVSCLAVVLISNEDQGIWGGTTPLVRDRICMDLADGAPVSVVLAGVNAALTADSGAGVAA
ncbi:transcription factor WhiB [Jatrophihabitans sp. GAS493]|uniref:WhiB family transcriptional regulator n=1 Tax=Jatrophihabitans sp. GAS493 TaxID=1907575 RepID=UPI000BC03AD0|nr:WhiB family transcriptional regulator [Jatrophihabitans sp. GAS493]SOD73285.1 transcription factor WhiB [Jatrophihabitans sp. GAS493]